MSWEFFDAFQEIYMEDKTINFPQTISSMRPPYTIPKEESNPYPSPSKSFAPQPCSSQLLAPLPFPVQLQSPQPCSSQSFLAQPSTSTTIPISDKVSTTGFVPNVSSERHSPHPCIPDVSPPPYRSTPTKSSKKTEKATRMRSLYRYRQRQLQIEKKRVEELQLLRRAIERSNELQEERNQLLRGFLNK
ncbi:hypothetical protein QE152_g35303 [Popillia japonica]|uniref:BZIP domain-containing protein n=1 Tax=Popillia japonica TaxID=7064 RepID=A0AAW1IFR0_POPJA